MAGEPGLEPGLGDSKSPDLPLIYSPRDFIDRGLHTS